MKKNWFLAFLVLLVPLFFAVPAKADDDLFIIEQTYGAYKVMTDSFLQYEYQSGFFLHYQLTDPDLSGHCFEVRYRKEGETGWRAAGYVGPFLPDYSIFYPGIYIPLTGNDIYGVYQFQWRYVKYDPAAKTITPFENESWQGTQSIWVIDLQTMGNAAQRVPEGIRFSWNAVPGAESYILKKYDPDFSVRSLNYPIGNPEYFNLLRWETIAELPKTATSYLYAPGVAVSNDYQLVCGKQDPFGNSGDLAYTRLGMNCFGSYDWMPAPTALTAAARTDGVIVSWTAPAESPIRDKDTVMPSEDPKYGNIPRHDPNIHYDVERSEDGGVTWTKTFFQNSDNDGRNLTENYYLDREVCLGRTYRYRVTAKQYLIRLTNWDDMETWYQQVSYTSYASDPVSVTCSVAPTLIEAADCTVEVPMDGDHPYKSAVVADDAPYTVSNVIWFEKGSSDRLADSDVFVAGKIYGMRVEYKAKPGNVFSESTKLSINGEKAEGPFNSLTYCGMTFTAQAKTAISPSVTLAGWTYGATAKKPVVTGNVGNAEVTYSYKVKGASDSSYTDTVPKNAGSYTVMASIAATHDYYPASATCDFTIAKAKGPAAPTGLAGVAPTGVGGSDGKITGTSSKMEYSKKTTFTTAYACTGSSITGLQAGTYYVRIKATANVKAGSAATVIVPEGTPQKLPAPVATIKADAVTGRPIVSWNAVEGAAKYLVYRKAGSNSWALQTADGITATTYQSSKATVGVSYKYRIVAVSPDAKELNSEYSNSVTMLCVLAMPTITLSKNEAGDPVISWKALTGAASYTIYRKVGSGSWSSLAAGLTGTSYTDTGLTVGKKYSYKVMAAAQAGTECDSAFSSSVSLTYTEPKLPAPVLSIAMDAVTGRPVVSWEAVEGASKYLVYRKAGSNSWVLQTSGGITATTYQSSKATVGVSYKYRVVAVSPKGSAYNSDYSGSVTMTCILPAPKLSIAKNEAGLPVISWTAVSGAAEYRIYRRAGSGLWDALPESVTVASFTDGSVTAGTEYSYKAVAVSSLGTEFNSGESDAVSMIYEKPVLPAPVLSIAMNEATGRPVITWDAVEGASKYLVYRKAGSNSWALQTANGITATSYESSKATVGVVYKYRVVAVSPLGKDCNSDYSASVSMTCILPCPVVTLDVDAAGKPLLSWNAVSGAAKYYVYRKAGSNPWTLQTTVGTTETSWLNAKVNDGQTYQYRVVAVSAEDKAFNSKYSTVVSMTYTAAR